MISPSPSCCNVDDDGEYAGDDADDNYDGDANCDYNQDYEC